MASNDASQYPRHGLVSINDEESSDRMADLANLVLDDVMYNIIHDIVLKAHREEKQARANSAAILVEAKAQATDPNSAEEPYAIEHEEETEAAKYKNGEVYIKGNPLNTITDIHCQKCGKPRLLHPTDGNGARKPDPNIDYCKKHPWIEKPYHDVYGQVYQPDGPGRGKKKKDMVNPVLEAVKANGLSNAGQDSPGGSPPAEYVPKLLNFPTGKCAGCGNAIMIKRLNAHIAKCIGGGGRESSRNANLKIQSTSNGTPPGSRTGTPAPSNSSSTKRDREDDFDSDSSPQKKSKKNGKEGSKKTGVPKKLKELKAPKMGKTSSQQREASNLSFEERAPGMSESEDDGDDYKDEDFGTIAVEPKKKIKITVSNGKKLGTDKKWSQGKGGTKSSTPSFVPPDTNKSDRPPLKIKIKTESSTTNGRAEVIGDSESSQTLSSPN